MVSCANATHEAGLATPTSEAARLAVLRHYSILDTEAEQAFDDLTTIAAEICETPIALVSFVDQNRQWFKSNYGLDAKETGRDVSFCAHAILQPDEIFIVPDTLADERFKHNSLVTQAPYIRFYAGVPLLTPDRHALGTLCVIDRQPRTLTPRQQKALQALARQVVSQMELRLNLSNREQMITQLQTKEAELRQSETLLTEKTKLLETSLDQLKHTQMKLIQAEKMSSLGQLVAGVAHEMNNPIGFIYSNLTFAKDYIYQLLELIKLYQKHYPQPVAEIQAKAISIDLDFIQDDVAKVLLSMKLGAQRIHHIIQSLRTFARTEYAAIKTVNLHHSIDNTLMLLVHRLRANAHRREIKIGKDFDSALPNVECYPGQLNQVFISLFNNAIDALDIQSNTTQTSEDSASRFQPTLTIRTKYSAVDQHVVISVEDNGCGISSETVKAKMFDPFFTTKPIGQGTGMGLSMSYNVITEEHGGTLLCESVPGKRTLFTIDLPVKLTPSKMTRSASSGSHKVVSA